MAVWQRRASYAPSAVTVPFSSPSGILVEQLRQERTVADAAGRKLHCANDRSGGVYGQMHPAPFTATLNTVLAGLPLAITKELDPGAVNQQVQWAIGTAVRRPKP